MTVRAKACNWVVKSEGQTTSRAKARAGIDRPTGIAFRARARGPQGEVIFCAGVSPLQCFLGRSLPGNEGQAWGWEQGLVFMPASSQKQ